MLLTAFIGGARRPEIAARDEDAIVRKVLADLAVREPAAFAALVQAATAASAEESA